jgi:hypothetical protein
VRRLIKIVPAVVIVLGCMAGAGTFFAQRKCYADSMTYALSFDCSKPKEVLRFLIFWRPEFFPVSVQ